MDFASYEHLWNGAETGWVVHRHIENRVEVTVVFGDQGSSMSDVRVLRSAVPQYGAQSAMEALLSIRGKKSLVLATSNPEKLASSNSNASRWDYVFTNGVTNCQVTR